MEVEWANYGRERIYPHLETFLLSSYNPGIPWNRCCCVHPLQTLKKNPKNFIAGLWFVFILWFGGRGGVCVCVQKNQNKLAAPFCFTGIYEGKLLHQVYVG